MRIWHAGVTTDCDDAHVHAHVCVMWCCTDRYSMLHILLLLLFLTRVIGAVEECGEGGGE